jgi:desulfoferrodoxin (superoxide reductase-like protein)
MKDSSPAHYIEKIGIMDKDKKDIAVKSIEQRSGFIEARFSLHPVPDSKDIKVYAKCNLHDLWTTPLADARRAR